MTYYQARQAFLQGYLRKSAESAYGPDIRVPTDSERTDINNSRESLIKNPNVRADDFLKGSFSYRDKLEAVYGKEQANEFIQDAKNYQASHGGLDAEGNNTAFGYRIGDVDKKIQHSSKPELVEYGLGGYYEAPNLYRHAKTDPFGNIASGASSTDEVTPENIALLPSQRGAPRVPFTTALHESMHGMSADLRSRDPVQIRALADKAVSEHQTLDQYRRSLWNAQVMPTDPRDEKLNKLINATGSSGIQYNNQLELLPILSEMKQLGRAHGFRTRNPADVSDFMDFLRKNKDAVLQYQHYPYRVPVSQYIRDPETLTSPEMEDTMKRLLPGIADAQSRMSYNNVV